MKVRIFCTEFVKEEIERLEKKGSYSNIRSLWYEYMLKHPTGALWMSGTRFRIGNPHYHCVKRYFGGSGAYRIYYVVAVKGDQVTISAFYPKTGNASDRATDLTDDGTIKVLKETYESIKSKTRWEIKPDESSKSINFEKEKSDAEEKDKEPVKKSGKIKNKRH